MLTYRMVSPVQSTYELFTMQENRHAFLPLVFLPYPRGGLQSDDFSIPALNLSKGDLWSDMVSILFYS